jgi:hypothetical protein
MLTLVAFVLATSYSRQLQLLGQCSCPTALVVINGDLIPENGGKSGLL